MPNQFFSPEGDLENYFVTEYWLIDQWVGDELWTWGQTSSGRLGNAQLAGNGSTPLTTFAGGTNWKQISCAQDHAAAVKTDGTLWLWGGGGSGRLGNASTVTVSTPVTTFAGGTNWKQVSTGTIFTSAIKTDGTLWVWGGGNSGQLGINVTITNTSTPITTFTGGTNWKQVSCGNDFMTAIKTDGTLWTWGNSVQGRLGRSLVSTNRVTPITTFAGGTNWANVATTEPEDLYTISVGSNSAAIKTDGTLWTWGSSSNSMLGNAVTTGIVSTPITTFAGGTNWKQVSTGTIFTSAIKTDGTLWVWGNPTAGVLGNGETTGNRSTPITTFAGGTNWKQVSTLSQMAAAIKTDGTLWTWGTGTLGRLGNGETTGNRSTPITTFAGGTNWKHVSVSGSHAMAIKTDGTLWTWGSQQNSILGNGATSGSVSTPITTFAGGTNWKQVSAGGLHTAAIKTDGTLWVWGSCTYGKLGNGNATTSAISTPVTTFSGGTNWKQVSCGGSHTVAVKTDGTLWTWGRGTYGQLGDNLGFNKSTPITTFAGGTNWQQTAAGLNNTLALRDIGGNKELFVWGNNGTAQLGTFILDSPDWAPNQTFAGGTNWKQVSAGNVHTAAIKTDGTLWAWGLGGAGRLGNLNTVDIITPVTTFAGGTNWKQTSCGSNQTLAIKTDGTLWGWGASSNAQIGTLEAVDQRNTPVTTFAGGTNWANVATTEPEDLYTLSAGGLSPNSAAIKTDGTLWIWGSSNANGQFGNARDTNSLPDISTPVTTFAGGTNWKQVSISNSQSAAIKTDGTLWIWGNMSLSGVGNATAKLSTPCTTFAGGTNWRQVSCGYSFTSAIKTDGTLWTWGTAQRGALGNGDPNFDRSTPVTTFAGGTNWKQVSSGILHGAAIKTDGTLWTWGYGNLGRLGNASLTLTVSTPVTTFAGGTNWKQVSCGNAHTAAIKTDGTLWVWGNNQNGRLGNGVTTTSNVSTPITTFAGGTNWKQVSAGGFHTAAIKTDGTLWTWGYGVYGRLGNNGDFTVFTPITTFAGGTNWQQVSCGTLHTIALSDIGGNKELFVWGKNSGRLGTNFEPLAQFNIGGTNWKQVFASSSNTHTAAIKTDGTLWSWGVGSSGVLGNGITTGTFFTPVTTFAGGTNWKQVSQGQNYAAAVFSGTTPDLPIS